MHTKENQFLFLCLAVYFGTSIRDYFPAKSPATARYLNLISQPNDENEAERCLLFKSQRDFEV